MGSFACASFRECRTSGTFPVVDELTLQLDETTTRRIQEFASSVGISAGEAAARFLRVAATVHQVMTTKGVLDADHPTEFVVSFERHPDGVGAVDFKRLA
jgi:hypothetical protein